jgi:hypothetical protein
MSDEQPPPQLRLRPRKREDETAPAVVAPVSPGLNPSSTNEIPTPPVPPDIQVPAPTAPAADTGAIRFRLKPKLAVEPVEVKTETVFPQPVSLPSPAPTDAPATDANATPEIPRLKLRSLGAAPAGGMESAPLPVLPPPLPPIIPGISVPPIGPPPTIPTFPAVPSIAEPALIGGLPPIPARPASVPTLPPLPPPKLPGAKPAPPVPAPSPYKKKPSAKRLNARVVLVALAGLLVLGGAGGYYFMMGAEETAPTAPVATEPAPALVAAPTPVPPELQIAPLPPQPSTLQAAADAAKRAPRPPAAPVVTPAFKSWVDDARVSGVVAGSSPRAIINGRLARPGDMVDAAEGIVFDGLNAEKKTLVFRSRVNAFLEKPY